MLEVPPHSCSGPGHRALVARYYVGVRLCDSGYVDLYDLRTFTVSYMYHRTFIMYAVIPQPFAGMLL